MIKINETIVVDSYDILTGEMPIGPIKINDPGKAIELWFKYNKDYPTCIAISPSNEKEAMSILQWASDNESKLKQWSSKYNSPYRFDYIMRSVRDHLDKGNSGIRLFPDQLHPFCLG